MCGSLGGTDLALSFRDRGGLPSLVSKGEAWTGNFVQGQESLYEARLTLGLRAGVATHQKLQDVIRNIQQIVTHSPGS